jgi:hypothetical protein
MYDAEIKKGALSIFVSHGGTFPVSKNVRHFINEELKRRFDKLETYQKFANNMIKTKKELIIEFA